MIHLINYIYSLNYIKNNKLHIEERHRFQYIMQNYCNVVISYQENWELNYLYLECFYLGIPLIHNSEILKEWGYYYPQNGCR